VLAPAVSGLDLEIIHILHRLGVAQNFIAVHGFKWLVVIGSDKLPHGLFRFGDGVKRLDWRHFLLGALFGNKRGIVRLNMRRIYEHDATEVAGGGGAMNFAGVTLFDEVGQIARMINVRVA